MVVMFGVCWDGFLVHFAPKMGFESIGNRLESKEMNEEVSGGSWSGGNAIAPTLGHYSATQGAFGRVGGSEYSVGELGISAVALLCSFKVPF